MKMKKFLAILTVMLLLFSCASATTYAKVRVNSAPMTIKIVGQGSSPVHWYKQVEVAANRFAWKTISTSSSVTIPRENGTYRVTVKDYDMVGHYYVAPLKEIKTQEPKPAVRVKSVRKIKK